VRSFREYTFEKHDVYDNVLDALEEELNSYYVRRFLSDIFQLRSLSESEVSILLEKWHIKKDFLQKLIINGILVKNGKRYHLNDDLNNFSLLISSYLARFLKSEFDIDAILNVKLKQLKDGGDVDILGSFKFNLIMAEIKESPPNNISVRELRLLYRRFESVDPDFFVFIIDTTLSIKRNIIDNLKALFGMDVLRLKEGVYQVSNGSYVITPKRDLLSNVRFVFQKFIL
jgi:hypothetical protein